jgi:hypothetical protein
MQQVFLWNQLLFVNTVESSGGGSRTVKSGVKLRLKTRPVGGGLDENARNVILNISTKKERKSSRVKKPHAFWFGVVFRYSPRQEQRSGPAEGAQPTPLTIIFAIPVTLRKEIRIPRRLRKRSFFMGRASRAKGARGERMLRDELRRYGWEDVSREGWKQVRAGQQESDDVVGRPPGFGREIALESKLRKTGFEAIYKLLPKETSQHAVLLEGGDCIVLALNPNTVLESTTHIPISEFQNDYQKVFRSVGKKCREWIGNSQILALKQDRHPWIYVRYRK